MAVPRFDYIAFCAEYLKPLRELCRMNYHLLSTSTGRLSRGSQLLRSIHSVFTHPLYAPCLRRKRNQYAKAQSWEFKASLDKYIYIYVRNQWGNLGKDAVCVFAMFDEADSWSHMQNIASWILLLTEDHVSKLVVCFARSQPRPVRGGCEGGDPKGQ